MLKNLVLASLMVLSVLGTVLLPWHEGNVALFFCDAVEDVGLAAEATGDAVFFELRDDDTAGVRPDRLYEVWPPEKVQRHTVDQIVDAVHWFPTLDVPVPPMVDEPVVTLQSLDFALPEQVIGMPKISLDFAPQRTKAAAGGTAGWKRRRSCLSWMLLNRPLTFQLAQWRLLVKLCSFLAPVHWPSTVDDLGVGGVSLVEFLTLYERWVGERLVLEMSIPKQRRSGRPISVSGVEH